MVFRLDVLSQFMLYLQILSRESYKGVCVLLAGKVKKYIFCNPLLVP